MIEKILDKYYTKKLKRYLDRELLFWFIDHRYKESKNYLKLQVKRREYNNEQYQDILLFNKQEIFIKLCNHKETDECLKERIDKYLEETK